MANFFNTLKTIGEEVTPGGRDYLHQLRQQNFETQQNELSRWQLQHAALADAVGKGAGQYAGPEGERLRDLEMEVHSLKPGTDLTPYYQKYSQHRQSAEKVAGQAPAQIPSVSQNPPPTLMNSSPFAPMIAQGGTAPPTAGPPAAQPPTSPVQPQAPMQGGGSSSPATFPAHTQASGPAPAPEPIPPAASVGGNPAVPALAPFDINRSVGAFNATGFIDPVTGTMLPGAGRLAQIEPYLGQMDPTMANFIRTSALGGSGMGAAGMLGMLSPQSIPGQETAASLLAREPEFAAANGLDKMDPNTPVRVQRSKLPPYHAVAVEVQSVPNQAKQFGEGVFNFNPRTGQYEPVNGKTPISMIPNEGVRLVQQPDGSIKLVPVETGKKPVGGAQAPITPVGQGPLMNPSTRLAPGQLAPPAGAPPVTARQGPAGVRGGGVTVGGRNLPPQQILQFKNSIEVGAHQLWGDPDNPALRPLASYSNLADDPGARDRISKALKLVLESGGSEGASHIGTSVGPVSFSAGGIGEWITNEFGVPQALAQQRAQIVRGAMDQLKPEELQYFNSLMNAIPTITGLRRLTGGAAFKWSQDALERELPMVGLAGTTSAGAFRQKMVALGDEVLTGAKNLARTNPEAVDPRLMQLIRSGGATAPIVPVQGREAQGGYQVGHKYGDLTYQGGNPNDRTSWK